MLDWYLDQALERQKELLREAEHHHQIRLATLAARNPFGLQSRAIVWLGSKLVDAGRSLQARGGFSITPSSPTLLPRLPSAGAGLPTAGITYLADLRHPDLRGDGTYGGA